MFFVIFEILRTSFTFMENLVSNHKIKLVLILIMTLDGLCHIKSEKMQWEVTVDSTKLVELVATFKISTYEVAK